jgi:Reverse transcriptase (RNA-dependent DNA polymerase)
MFSDFVTKIDSKFYNHIHKKSSIPLLPELTKEAFCKNLLIDIQNRSYHPSTPRDYIVYGKENLISRIVPVLQTKDMCVYYYCIKILELDLSKTRVEDTFGGFSMGGTSRKYEDLEFSAVSEQDSVSSFPYNPIAWAKEWGDFQTKAYTYSQLEDYQYFIKFDIANFYDCINLSYLETKIRSSCNREKIYTIDLLMYFLKNWNRDFEQYKQKNIGLPQDEIGDCSRVLANFYLHEYDLYIKSEAEKLKCKILRYADDSIIYAKNEESAKKLLFLASNYLSKINLNLNSKKIDIFESKETFKLYWSFDTFENLAEPFEKNKIELAIKKYLERKERKFRKDSILKRIVNILYKSKMRIDLNLRK